MDDLARQILRDIKAHNLIAPGPLVVAVSGGADSLALLHVLRDLGALLRIRLLVATLDHGLRGDEGAADVRFVSDMAAAWDIPVTAAVVDVRALAAEHGEGIEAAARRARYSFLARVAREQGAAQVAAAHHADDQAETILMHLLRGSGLRGLSGMRPSAPLPGALDLTLVRPLLGVTRDRLQAYCAAHGLEPRIDSSNSDTTLMRNRIRHEVMPVLVGVNPAVRDALNRLGEAAALDAAFIEEAYAAQVAPHIVAESDRHSISREQFAGLHPALQGRFVMGAVRELAPDSDVSSERVGAAVRMVLRGKVGARAQFPGGAVLRLDYETVVVEIEAGDARIDAVMPLLAPGQQVDILPVGVTPIPGAGWSLGVDEGDTAGDGMTLYVAPDARISLRTRQPGDRFAPLGMGGHSRKVKDWMIDHRVPRAIRHRVPLLVIDGEIGAMMLAERWVIGEAFSIDKQWLKKRRFFVKYS